MTTSMEWRRLTLAFAAAAVLVAGMPAMAQTTDLGGAGGVVTINGTGGDVNAGGAVVTIRGPADSVQAGGAIVDIRVTATDSVSAGGAQVTVDGDVGRDLSVGGAVVTVRGQVKGDLRAGGAVVEIDADVAGDAKVGAASLTLSRNTSIGGDFKGGGASVMFGADVAGDVKLGGAAVTFAGKSGGDVEIWGEDVTISGLARITGSLTVNTRSQPNIASSAVIGGEIIVKEPGDWFDGMPPWMGEDPPRWVIALGIAAFVAVGAFIAGFLLILFGGRLLGSSAGKMRHSPVMSLVFGLFTIIVVAVVGLAILFTGIGFTAGIAVLALMPVILVFGHATAATGIMAAPFGGGSRSYGPVTAFFFLLVGSIVIALLGLIPWVGPWLVAVIILTGTGAFSRTFFGRLRRRDDLAVETVEAPPAVPEAAPPVSPPQPESDSAHVKWEQGSEGGEAPPRA